MLMYDETFSLFIYRFVHVHVSTKQFQPEIYILSSILRSNIPHLICFCFSQRTPTFFMESIFKLQISIKKKKCLNNFDFQFWYQLVPTCLPQDVYKMYMKGLTETDIPTIGGFVREPQLPPSLFQVVTIHLVIIEYKILNYTYCQCVFCDLIEPTAPQKLTIKRDIQQTENN